MAGPTAATATTNPGIARATLQGFLAELLVFPAGLITAVYLTRTLGPDRYGALSLVYAALAPVSWIAATTLAGRVGVKLLADAPDWRLVGATLLRANAVLGILAGGAFAALAPLIASFLRHPELRPYLQLAAVEIALVPIIRLHRDGLIARGQYAWPAVATVAYQLARLALVLALVFAGWSIGGVIAANLVARLLELVACRVRLALPVRGRLARGLTGVGQLVGALFVYALCLQIFNRMDLLLLGYFDAPADAIGNYGAAQNLAQAPGLFALVFAPLTIAALRRASLAGNSAELDRLTTGSARVALAILALALPVAAGASRLTVLLFGPGFGLAGAVLGWLAIGAGAGVVLAVLSAHEVAAGRYYRPLIAAVPMLIAGLVLELWWIPRAGALGAARATGLASIGAALIAQGFVGPAALGARVIDLGRSAVAGAAGYGCARLGGEVGLPPVVDILAGWVCTAAVLVLTGLTSVGEARRIVASVFGKSSLELGPA